MMPSKFFFAGLFFFLPLALWAQCDKISLQADKGFVCGSGLVRFELNGAKDARTIEWDFGNGYRQGSDTLFEFLTRQGWTDVNIRITWKDNSVCTTNFDRVTLVRALPTATFSMSRDKLCDGPDTVRFSCTDSVADRISWIIDGTNYFNHGREVNHRFASTGEKGLTLIVHDSFGCRGITEVKKAIVVYPDVVLDIQSDKTNGCVPLNISLKSKVDTKGQKIVSWVWSLPGLSSGNFYSEHLNAVQVNQSGEYDITLRVQTENGCVHELTKPKLIQMGDSVPVQMNFIKPMYCFNETIYLRDAYAKIGGTYTWNLPSKATDIKSDEPSARSFRIPEPGIYPFTVKYERNGCATTKTFDSALIVHRVKADFVSTNNFHCTPPLSVQISNKSTSSDSGFMSYFWQVRDDSRVIRMTSNKDLSMNFSNWGYYDVELLVVHANGCRDTMRRKNFVRIDTIRPEFVVEPSIACINQTIRFKNVTLPSTYVGNDTFFWVFYDKNGKDVLGTSRLREPEFSYPDTGFYPVALMAGNTSGCARTLLLPKAIEIIKPALKPVIHQPVVCTGTKIQFSQQTSPVHAPFTHFWYVHENGGTGKMSFQSKDTSVLISGVGTYDVIYAIQIANGCRDSVILPAAVSVNGVVARVLLDGNSGCLPYKVNSEASILKNQHTGSSDQQVQYKWVMNPSQHVNLQQNQPQKLSAEFLRNGIYEFSLEVQNSTGCKTNIKSEQVFAGVDARASISDRRVCIGAPVDVSSASQLRATSFSWSSPDSGLIFQSNYLPNNKLIPHREGIYTLRLIAGKNNQCFDTAEYTFEAIEVRAAFHSLDTELTCAPVYAQFISTSKNADDLVWDFGDGEEFITTLPNAGHVYFKNSGWDRGFDVNLIARSREGCSDTLKKPGYVWVRGPVPQVDMKNLKGCEPLEVLFENRSRDAVLFVTDFGNGASRDSSGITSSFTYRVEKDFLDTQYFKPVFYAYDSLGCIARFEPDTQIMVKRAPLIRWGHSPLTGCEPVTFNYHDQTGNAVHRLWEIQTPEGDKRDSLRSGNVLLSRFGSYQVKLTVQNQHGCSAERKEIVQVNSTPKANISFSDTVCFQQSYHFANGSSIGHGALMRQQWNLMSQGHSIDTSTERDWTKYFDQSGNFTLWHKVISDKECSDSTQISVHVPHPDEIPSPAVKMATVNESGNVDLIIHPVNYYRAQALSVAHNSSHLFFENNLLVSTFKDLPFDGVYQDQCYDASVLDICDYQGKRSVEHCVVRLSTESNSPFTARLTWTPYTGWDAVAAYQVFRREEGKTEEMIAELPSDQLEYLDSPLCNRKYIYRIAAWNNDRSLQSFSNRSEIFPMYHVSDIRLNIRSIRVSEDNQELEVRWDPSYSDRFSSYSLKKSRMMEDGSLVSLGVVSTDENRFTDTEVDPSAERYVYSVAETDVCGNDNETGLEGVSVLLGGHYDDYKAFLNWTPYGRWSTGVKNYEIQIRDPKRGFIEVEKSGEQNLSAIDSRTWPEIQEDYCYRIIAVSNETIPDTSSSNVICLNGQSQIHVPNAFTPNGDGKNDVFRPVTIFGYNQTDNAFKMYRFEVFNRWGERIFETNKIEEGWDGTYMGEKVESGMFMYQIRFFGLDHKVFMKEGSFLLMR